MELKHKIESVLFITGEPVSIKKLLVILNEKRENLEGALEELTKDYASRGIILIRKEDEWQFGTNPENARLVEDLAKSAFTEDLSRAALETLSIVAYKGPLTRLEIEFIRGVNSSFTIRNLLMRGLVERIENPKDARSYLYKISFDFLKHLGLSAVHELPEYEIMRGHAEERVAQMASPEKNMPSAEKPEHTPEQEKDE
ncbi:MAG: SMC-Scp complex subunit ScpB [Candidatus Sungbacteria bacterium RIFCSPLOWO2_02_FULL_51_17]|uniref:SMC-Scp complex subunit ScpB n=1 Tax=Candidatus Sungbacteria bacterium RIFCSPHIGHO2_02_FULL_51_29 TaxID=1802273 RepID=A0A1G2KVU6_9BACT|nr:MAG: SMC-Scp complex subunit ScpB [Candidatus Sungbacteria bacterium RIFCSPHIGHO2_01_FULL_51_22]OHA03546.1 MAG: SMC-Scp complex subunit ScpB [Candidatus Sungbacteria bacterium RIFCSPHIGHO2_02_FULL_51_29]OHA10759.1 MAG: SMC-Scp complex subunit ScpB [Candidatus Sungbacteria bacterium RIFCSPLOWO2_02_FULL_51_17]